MADAATVVLGAAVITGASSSIGNWINGRFALKAAREARDIVKGNGKGPVDKMVEELLAGQNRHEVKLDDILEWQGKHESLHARQRP